MLAYAAHPSEIICVPGASAGVGEAIALEFARQGSHLMLCGRDKTRLDLVVDQCRHAATSDIKVCSTVGDITSELVQRSIIDSTVTQLGCIDVLVNNAGVVSQGDYSLSREEYQRVMTTNLESILFLTQLAIPHLRTSKGNIVNISSIVSLRQSHNVMAYTLSKAALDSYTRALAMNLASQGIRVNSVNPGSVRSLIYKRGEQALGDNEYAKLLRMAVYIHFFAASKFSSGSEISCQYARVMDSNSCCSVRSQFGWIWPVGEPM
ncbi:reductase [Elysia marginata]|uniref:Reductase n=1 Tax=Elysia marginata TaxID=1093978 RepID=A0AAV4GK53_9GAST|nr:reductase [Elysia marginata]